MIAPNLLSAIHQLVEAVPSPIIHEIGRVLANNPSSDWANRASAVQAVLPTPAYRAAIQRWVAAWRSEGAEITPATMAAALLASAHTYAQLRSEQHLELVWTGPASGYPLRRTAQVLFELIDGAAHELLIVAFAVYDIPEIGAALQRAQARGVAIHLVLEGNDTEVGRIAAQALQRLGMTARTVQLSTWPIEQRPLDAAGHRGALQAKCAIADGQHLLISSANLTRYALDLNIELGVLVRGGSVPQQVVAHLRALMARGVLVGVA